MHHAWLHTLVPVRNGGESLSTLLPVKLSSPLGSTQGKSLQSVQAVADKQKSCRARRNVGAPLAAFGLATQPGYPVKKGVNSKDDPIRTGIWDADMAAGDKAVAVSR